ncbi:DEAD/DEAH box helicase family protein [Haloplasma contractile]|uniref:DNA excision repair protein ERCC-3 n=1 Tax=Haloplasma contractile SSD-17B TaxID=1033810 RepID=U2EB28_9MOLU|nr:DEAD/DEAH box helicase family protein [Haloplasma contractile]ERJ12308.1 DNA excision repair protein ERCC-3 [Haloplasma contractile SSD-17B]
MKDFKNVSFHGEFRTYQQNVLDNVTEYLDDRKVHIVAAPGSGKTILGLELIRRLDAPALIFSPSITIRQQWGERFEEKFIDQDQHIDDYVSYDLTKIKLLTSVTYQGLHAALNKQIDDERDEELYEDEQAIDYTTLDLIKTVKEHKIKTICLDEAHHLRTEWQRSLELFLKQLGNDITVISLTATPPYDSSTAEWQRYTSLCGEIDEEIFIPELVSQGTLCPHQDYIYFNYPTEPEIETIKDYKETVFKTINEIVNGDSFQTLMDHLFKTYKEQTELILENPKEYIALLTVAKFKGMTIPKKLVKLVSPSGRLPLRFKLTFAEIAFQYIIDNPALFTKERSTDIKKQLKSSGLIERKKVKLKLNNKLKRLLISSSGKLNSIAEIAKSEAASLKGDLRMLVLTDYIKKDMMPYIATGNMPNTMGIVSIYERIRLEVGNEVKIGVLSGSLIIVPNSVIEQIKTYANEDGIDLSVKPIPNTDYSEIRFKGSNKHKVKIMTKVFEQGSINILIGTKSLLGEGWDSPCINSLILASFVGSFMLSNQMRGRAIRVDRHNPDKTANIWHLATIEPTYMFTDSLAEKLYAMTIEEKDEIVSEDFDTLKRRFNGFLGPSYNGETIESGIDRIDIIKPPFNRNGIKQINHNMLTLANNRMKMVDKWNKTLHGTVHPVIMETSEIPPKVLPKKFIFINLLNETLLSMVLITLIRGLLRAPITTDSFFNTIIYLTFISVVIYLMTIGYYKLLKYISPKKTIKTLGNCILSTLKDIGEISTIESKVLIESDSHDTMIQCILDRATRHEKRVFASAMKELLSSIDNPRYLLIKKGLLRLNYDHSFACPSIIGVKKKNASIFKEYLQKTSGKIELAYTRNQAGRKHLLKCRRHSYINRNETLVYNKKMVGKWE